MNRAMPMLIIHLYKQVGIGSVIYYGETDIDSLSSSWTKVEDARALMWAKTEPTWTNIDIDLSRWTSQSNQQDRHE